MVNIINNSKFEIIITRIILCKRTTKREYHPVEQYLYYYYIFVLAYRSRNQINLAKPINIICLQKYLFASEVSIEH